MFHFNKCSIEKGDFLFLPDCKKKKFHVFRKSAVKIKELTVKKTEFKPNVLGLGQKIIHLNFVEAPKRDETS